MQACERRHIQAIPPLSSELLGSHETALAQHAEVPRHGRATDVRERVSDLPGGVEVMAAQQVENVAARRVGERVEGIWHV